LQAKLESAIDAEEKGLTPSKISASSSKVISDEQSSAPASSRKLSVLKTPTKAAAGAPKTPATAKMTPRENSLGKENTQEVKPPRSASKKAATPKENKATPKSASKKAATPKESKVTPGSASKKPTTPKESKTTPNESTPAPRRSPNQNQTEDAPNPQTAELPQSGTAPEIKKEFNYEFGGPVGALGVMFGLPTVIYGLFFFCGGTESVGVGGVQQVSCLPGMLPSAEWLAVGKGLVALAPPVAQWWSLKAAAIFTGWFFFQAFLQCVLPGEVRPTATHTHTPSPNSPLLQVFKEAFPSFNRQMAKGTTLSDGSSIKYPMNGHLAFWVSLLAMGHFFPTFNGSTWEVEGLGAFPLHQLYDEYLGLITTSVQCATLFLEWHE
jgi:hypothetical protein